MRLRREEEAAYKPVRENLTILKLMKGQKNYVKFDDKTKERYRSNALASAWNDTYPPDGYEPIYKKFESTSSISTREDNQEFLNSKITRVTSFFGISNYRPRNGPQSWKNIGKQFLNLPDKNYSLSDAKWLPFYILFVSVPSIAFNLVFKVIPKTAINAVKFFTEYQLTLARNYSMYKALTADTAAGRRLGTVFYIITSALLFPVRAITSPTKNARSAFKFGHELGNGGKAGMFLGLLFGGLSTAMTAAAYTIIFPLGIKFLIGNGLPWVASHMGPVGKGISFIGSKLITAGSSIAHLVGPASNAVGNLLTSHLAPVLKLVGLNSAPASTLGFSALCAMAMATVGSGLTRLKDKVVNMIHRKLNRQFDEIELEEANKRRNNVEDVAEVPSALPPLPIWNTATMQRTLKEGQPILDADQDFGTQGSIEDEDIRKLTTTRQAQINTVKKEEINGSEQDANRTVAPPRFGGSSEES